MKGIVALFFLAICVATIGSVAVYFKAYREAGTVLDIWFYIADATLILMFLVDYLKAIKFKEFTRYGRAQVFIYIILLLLGFSTLFFHNGYVAVLFKVDAPKLLLQTIEFHLIMMRNFTLFNLCTVVFIFYFVIGMITLAKLKRMRLSKLDSVYNYIHNPKFNLVQFYKDYKEDMDSKPFGNQDMKVLKDTATIRFSGPVGEENCIICFSEYEKNEKIIEMPVCGHQFHGTCISVWLKEKNQCPTCRAFVRYNMLMGIHIRVTGNSKGIGIEKNEVNQDKREDGDLLEPHEDDGATLAESLTN